MCLCYSHNQSLIQLKETEKLELEKKTREATDELEHIRDDVSEIVSVIYSIVCL